MTEQQFGTILKFDGDLHSAVGVEPTGFGRPAENQSGVVYRGPWETEGGFGEHVRRCALALAMSGEPVQLIGNQSALMRHDHTGRKLLDRMRPVTDTTIASPWCRIEQLVPSDEALMRLATHPFLTPQELAPVLRSTVLSVVYEREQVSAAAAACLNAVGQVWVACQANADMLIRSGVQPGKVRVVPIPYMDDDPLLRLRGRKRRPGAVRFTSIGKWEPRKEHRNVLGAFMLAFKPGDPVQLYLRTNAFIGKCPGYPQGPAEALNEWLADDRVKARGWTEQNYQRHLFMLGRHLSGEQMVELHRVTDVYVSLSRGEGFEMPAYDSVLAGNLMVYTPSGGPQDFAAPRDLMVPFNDSVPCHPMYRWPQGSTYGDYSVETAAEQLRAAFELVTSGRVGDTAPADMSAFRAEVVGDKMLQYLNELTA